MNEFFFLTFISTSLKKTLKTIYIMSITGTEQLRFIGSVQFSCSVMSDSLWPHEPQHTRPPCPLPILRVYPNSCPLSRWCHPAISSCRPLLPLPSILPSIRVFSNESALRIRWPKYWCFSFNTSPFNEHPSLISFRMDWWDLLAVQGTLKSLFQHHNSKVSILWCSAFFVVQLSHPYMTTGKTIALTRRTSIDKVMSLLFNMPSRWLTLILGGSKITADGDCSHEIKRHLLFGRKVMTSLDRFIGGFINS